MLPFSKHNERFPNLRLAYQAMEQGGNMPCILNAANEVVNLAFREGRCGFLQMSDIIEQTMTKTTFITEPTYDNYVQTDQEARKIATELLKLWNFGILNFWNYGILKFRNPEILKFWNYRILKSWNPLINPINPSDGTEESPSKTSEKLVASRIEWRHQAP